MFFDHNGDGRYDAFERSDDYNAYNSTSGGGGGGGGGGIGGCGFWLWFFIIYTIIELIIKL
ncbi:MAG: hypothetical protein ACI4PP_06755 [Clostridia bacterium]